MSNTLENKWKFFQETLAACNIGLILDPGDYLDGSILLSAENELKGLGPRDKPKDLDINQPMKSLGTQLLPYFHPNDLSSFFKRHSWLSKELKKKNSMLANAWLVEGIKQAKSYRHSEVKNEWFERLVQQLQKLNPNIEQQKFKNPIPNIWRVLDQDMILEMKTLSKCGFSFNIHYNESSLNGLGQQSHFRIQTPEMLLALLDHGFSIPRCNSDWMDLNPNGTGMTNPTNFICFFTQNTSALKMIEAMIEHPSFTKQDLKKWHQSTVNTMRFQMAIAAEVINPNYSDYLQYLIHQYPCILEWNVEKLKRNTSGTTSMREHLIEIGKEKFVAQAELIQSLKLKSNTMPPAPRF